MKLGTTKVRDTMTKMHLHQGDGTQDRLQPRARSLGTGDVTPLTLAVVLRDARQQRQVLPAQPDPVDHHADKKPLKLGASPCKQVIDPDVAKGATELLKGVIKGGTGRGARRSARDRPPARPAPPTTTSSPGSSATPPSAPRPCGSERPTPSRG